MMFALLALLLSACENPMRTTLEGVVRDYSTPTAQLNHPDGEGIAEDSVVVIAFSETMDTATLTATGSLFAGSDGGVWSGTEEKPDSVWTVTPASRWTLGSTLTLEVECSDMEGYPCEDIELEYGVLDGVVYVRTDGGDGDPGTPGAPKGSIQAAIDRAAILYDQAEVRVAEGEYVVYSQLGTNIVMEEGVSLYGGYSADDWSERDPVAYETVISDNSSTGTNATMNAGSAVTVDTILDGFLIRGASGSLSTCLFLAGSPTIAGCILEPGGASSVYAIAVSGSEPLIEGIQIRSTACDNWKGIFLQDADATIRGCRIECGSGNYVTGIALSGGAPVIEGNRIGGGLSPGQDGYGQSVGVMVSDAEDATVIRNNVIDGGEGYTCKGIWCQGASPRIYNNIVIAGRGFVGAADSEVIGIELFSHSHPVIENNIIFSFEAGLRTGVQESGTGNHPTILHNNLFFDCPNGNYYFNYSPYDAYVTDPTTLEVYLIEEGMAESTVGGNLFNVDPLLDSDYRFTDSSPVSITEGGVDLSSAFDTDFDGTSRTTPWSMGAFERD